MAYKSVANELNYRFTFFLRYMCSRHTGFLALPMNAIILKPDRFLAYIGCIVGIFGIAIAMATVYDENFFSENEKLIEIMAVCIAVLILLTPFATLASSVYEPEVYSKILSRQQSFSKIIKSTAFLIYLIIKYINSKEGAELEKAIDRIHLQLKTIENMYEYIGLRLKISEEIIAEDFFNFSPSIFVNRQNKRAYKENYINDKYIEIDEKTIVLSQIKKIHENANNTSSFVKELLQSSIDLNRLEMILKMRSSSGAIEYFVEFIQKNQKNFTTKYSWFKRQSKDPKRVHNFGLFNKLQKSYCWGIIADRIIGMTLVSLIRDCNENILDDDKLQIYLQRIKCISGQDFIEKTVSEEFLFMVDWVKDTRILFQQEREDIWQQLQHNLVNDTTCRYKSDDGKTYFVIKDYSRTVRKTIRNILDLNLSFEYEVFIENRCNHNDINHGSRLMEYQLKNETDYSDDNTANKKVWSGSPEALMSQMSENDKLVYIFGCEEIGNNHTAYLQIPQSTLNQYRFRDNHRQNISIITLGGAYKQDLRVLLKKLPDKVHNKSEFEDVIDKYLESDYYVRRHLHKWTPNYGIDLLVISSRDITISYPSENAKVESI